MGGRVSFLYKTYAGKENVEAITKAGFKVDVLNLFSIGNEYQVNTSLAVNNSRQLATINVTGVSDDRLRGLTSLLCTRDEYILRCSTVSPHTTVRCTYGMIASLSVSGRVSNWSYRS